MSKRSFDGYVTITQLEGLGMVTLRAKLIDKNIAVAVRKATGGTMPAKGQITKGACSIGWMSPDEALILSDNGPATANKLQEALATSHALVADVSDARAVFKLEGADIREVLAKLTPVDVAAVTAGELRRTRLAQVAAAFWFDSAEEATVVCFASVADYMFALLSVAARPGSEVFTPVRDA